MRAGRLPAIDGRVLYAGDAAASVREIAHTADVGFEVEAPTLEALFERAALGLSAVVAELDGVVARERRTLAVSAEDQTALLHDFLHAILLLGQVDGFLVSGVEVTEIGGQAMRAVVVGERVDPARHRLHGEVKAVTWHGLAVERSAAGWHARVLLDV
jgi:SHS2 domain-containing protein